ncbi:MAG: hypothetical protein ACYDCK_15405 [Thermoplasmatota archaeon]
MPQLRATLLVASIAFIGLVAGGLAGAYAYYDHLTVTPQPVTAAGSATSATTPARDYLYLTIEADPVSGFDTYLPSNFTVPAHEPIVVTITNYDDGANPVSAERAQVRGTLGGVMTVGGDNVTHLASDGVSHTFTIDGVPGGEINVPIPPATDATHPERVTFTIEFGAAGTYTWMCYAPCDDHSMGLPGRMMGNVLVA